MGPTGATRARSRHSSRVHGAGATPLGRVAPYLVAVAATLAALLAIEPWPVGVFQDDGIYAVLARSLATGEGYRYLNIPGAPVATHYPPGYPAFLALLWKGYPHFPQNVTLFKFANAVLLGVAATGFYHLARRRLALAPWQGAAGVVAFTACAPVIFLTVMVLSEPLFLALLAPALLASERSASSGGARDAVLAGLLSAALAMVRTIGILIVPATLLVLVWRRHWRAAALLAVTATAAMLPWQLWVSAHAGDVPAVFLGKYGSYLGWLGDAVAAQGITFLRDVAAVNLRSLVEQGWATTATETLPVWLRASSSIALSFFFGLGLVALGGRAPVAALFAALYLAIVVVWPFAPARFTWGVWPLIGLAYTMAAVTVARWPMRIPRLAAGMALALLAVGYTAYNWRSASAGWWTQVQKGVADRARPLAAWVSANTDSNSVVATDDDVLIFLYTGRRAIPNGVFTPQEHLVPQTPAFAATSLRRIMRTFDVDFVLASSDYGVFAARGLMQATPPELRLLGALRTGAVFAPVTDSAAAADSAADSTTATAESAR